MTRAAEPIAIRSRGDRVSFTVRPRSLVVAVAVALLLLIVVAVMGLMSLLVHGRSDVRTATTLGGGA